MVQEWAQDIFSKPFGGVFIETDRAQVAAIREVLAVIPGAGGEEVQVVTRVMLFYGCISGRRPVDILLIPEAVHVECRHQPAGMIEPLISRAVTPVIGVGRVIHQVGPHFMAVVEIRAKSFPQGALTQCPAVEVPMGVRVVKRTPFASLHAVNEFEGVNRPKGPPVKPVIGFPDIDDRVEWNCRRQRRMGFAHGRQGQPARIRGAPDSDLAVVVGDVLDQPVDRVPGVGSLIGPGLVVFPSRDSIHLILAFRLIPPAQILSYVDIAVSQKFRAEIHFQLCRRCSH